MRCITIQQAQPNRLKGKQYTLPSKYLQDPLPSKYLQNPSANPPIPSTTVLAKFKLARSKLDSKSFAQATKDNAADILKVKEAFPKLALSKIIKIHNITQGTNHKAYPKLNMTTKGPSRKQVIIPMS